MTEPNGTTAVTINLSAGVAGLVSFADHYGYVTVTVQTGAADPVYVRTDGIAAVVAANDNYVVLPGDVGLFANATQIWYQSSNVLRQGSVKYPTGGGGTSSTYGGSPGGVVPPMSDLAGQDANTGTIVSLISAGAATVTVAAAA